MCRFRLTLLTLSRVLGGLGVFLASRGEQHLGGCLEYRRWSHTHALTHACINMTFEDVVDGVFHTNCPHAHTCVFLFAAVVRTVKNYQLRFLCDSVLSPR